MNLIYLYIYIYIDYMIEWRQFKKISCKLANQAETNPYLNRLKLCVCVCKLWSPKLLSTCFTQATYVFT